MGDAHGTEPDPNGVVPPPPYEPDPMPAASGLSMTPLAPPLGPPPEPPAGPPLPPYAGATAAGPPAPYPSPPYPSASAPYPSAPRASSNRLGIVLAVVGGVVVLGVVGVAVVVGLLLGTSGPSTPAPPTAIAEPDPDAPADDPTDADPSGIEARLEAKIEEYKRLRDSGALWQSIPDTEFNRTALSAFLYLLTDMKVATMWGVDAAQAQEFDDRAAMLEERLLAQEPFGDDIRIELEDRIFTYDGETGEGGFTDR